MSVTKGIPAVVAQWVRAFAPQAEGWAFKSQLGQTEVVKTGSDSSIAKCLALGVSVKRTLTAQWP